MSDTAPIIIANLKANKTWDEVNLWLKAVGSACNRFNGTIIVCPSHPFLAASSGQISASGWQLKLGSQDVSRFEQGAYTGEVAASQLKGLVDYVIIGHSERRQNFGEDEQILATKVQNAQKAAITPVFCIQDQTTPIPSGVTVVAYEPIFAIGTGNPDTPENAKSISEKLKAEDQYTVLYGGSVTAANAAQFLKKGVIDGLLIGSASLDAQNFLAVIQSFKKTPTLMSVMN